MGGISWLVLDMGCLEGVRGSNGSAGPPVQPETYKQIAKTVHFGSSLLIFAVFDPSRPPEGHYDPCVVLRHDNQVVYGVDLLYSTWNNNITLISLRKVTDFGPKWPVFVLFSLFWPLLTARGPLWPMLCAQT